MRKHRILALALTLVMLLVFVAGCGPKESGEPTTGGDSPKSTAAPAGDDKTTKPAGEVKTDPADKPDDGDKAIDVSGPADAALADWSIYDKKIADIKKEGDLAKREAMMHEAEDILMDTGALCPIYFYNDTFMMKPSVKGVHASLMGMKYFMFASNGDSKVLKLNISSEPAKLDPHLNSSVDGGILANNSFSGLFTTNAEGKTVPDLVESFEKAADGMKYTFVLKDGLKWSNGDPLTAKDFEYSWKRAASPETAADYAYLYDIVKGYPDNLAVKASDDGKTLEVELIAPCAYFLDLCGFPTFFPVHQKSVESAKGYKGDDGKVKNPGAWALEAGFVSNGAYVLTDWKHKESMIYKKNPNYHNADDVKIEELQFMLSADATAVYNAYKAGDLDFIDDVPPDEIPNAKKSDEWNKIDQLGTYYVCFNVKSEKLFGDKTPEQAKALRKAFAVLVDREYIVDTVGQTDQVLANTFIPEGMADGQEGVFRKNDDAYTYPNKDDVGYYALAPDLDLARKYLVAAGYKLTDDGKLSDETPLALDYITNESEGHVKIAECMQQDLKEVGIDMKIKTMAWDTFLEQRKAGQFDIARNGWIADYNDPINMLEMWTSDSGNNDAQLGK